MNSTTDQARAKRPWANALPAVRCPALLYLTGFSCRCSRCNHMGMSMPHDGNVPERGIVKPWPFAESEPVCEGCWDD